MYMLLAFISFDLYFVTSSLQVFCICFLHVDATWTQQNAVRTDFGKIIGELKACLQAVLARGPRSLEDFKHIAAGEGMNLLL